MRPSTRLKLKNGQQKMTDKTIHIEVPVLARVEGEGALELTIQDNRLQDLKLRIYEPPRFFEKLLAGRAYNEVMDIVARICGICPVAYQMSAVQAIESCFNINISPGIRNLRRLMYCGEWIESHALHIHMLAAPDFLGLNNVIEMAEQDPDIVRRGLKLQNLGNRIIRELGGRSVHPVSICAGGFSTLPKASCLQELLRDLEEAVGDAAQLIEWTTRLNLPSHSQEFCCVALSHADEYAINDGTIKSSDGLNIDITKYQDHFIEQHVPHSTALHSTLNNHPYLVGPLARLNLNHETLPDDVRAIISRHGITLPNYNMYYSIIARAIEIYFAITEAIRILKDYSAPDAPALSVTPQAGVGYGCTEAPRGILWHRYELDKQGFVSSATIVPPTSQNQARIEEDIRITLETVGLDRSDDELRLEGERVIRNYDPCISCATHFLKLRVTRN
jgi:sulfhydrogenase subunit alpha